VRPAEPETRRRGPAAPNGPEQMKAVLTARLRRLQRLPHIVRGFFVDPELALITVVAWRQPPCNSLVTRRTRRSAPSSHAAPGRDAVSGQRSDT
jgi:hypothetical protein